MENGAERNRNIDLLKAGTILLITMYHSMAVTGKSVTEWFHINHFMSYGGEIGVTLFFIMSGLGITYSLYLKEQKGACYKWGAFMKRRLIRIVPQYYVCVLVLVICSGNRWFFTKEGCIHIISHLGFFHNFSLSTHGSINGALWTMGVIMQFYLIAPLLYRVVKKHPFATCFTSVLVTIVSKMIVFGIVERLCGENTWCYFMWGRQLLTSLDNFVIGMVIGYFLVSGKEDKVKNNRFYLLFIVIDLILIDLLIIFSNSRNRLANTKTGWLWYSCLAVVLGHFVWNFARFRFKRISVVLLWISKYEYGIYLWHLAIMKGIFEHLPWVQYIAGKSYILFTVLSILLACLAGYISTKIIDEGIMKKIG